MLKKVYSKIGALRRLKRLVPANTMLLLYKSFVLSHFEYCNSLLVGIGKTLNKKLEDANYYGLRTIMNTGKSIDFESILRMADMNTLEQSLMIFFKCFKENGPGYVANLFKPRVTPYNLRSNGLNVVQTSYNSRFLHGSAYAYMISHIWNQLPSAVKIAPNGSSFRRLLTKLNFIGCQCSNCLWPDLFLEIDVIFFYLISCYWWYLILFYIVKHFYHEPVARGIGRPPPVHLTLNKLSYLILSSILSDVELEESSTAQ